MLRRIRVILALVFFAAVTLLFLDFTGTAHAWLGWMAKVQFLPAVLALNAGVIVALLALTLVFGRVYCSVICPLGVMQDVAAWFGKRRKRNRYSYSPAVRWLRYGVLAVFVAALAAGIGSVVALLAPYSSYGRIASNLFAPVYAWVNNLLAWMAERADSYAFYETEVWMKSLPTFVVAAVTFVAVAALAWRNGRTYCNTVCPVGTVLGFVARWSWLKPVIDTEKCRNCGLCGRQCKASCINMKEHRIDYSRCVACFDCIGACNEGAISYRPAWKRHGKTSGPGNEEKTDAGRRAFVTSSAIVLSAAALKAQDMKVDGGLAVIQDKKAPSRMTPLKPAGSMSLRHFSDHCTACQLCVSVCPNHVLRPSSAIETLMQPEMSFEKGWCRPECTKCSEVCPSGPIVPVTVEEKSSIQTGHAVVVYENCVVNTDGVSCGNCARHCPSGAIMMVMSVPGDKDSLRIPAVDTERCIGCGACEYLCPARPYSAIYVEGHEVHRTI